MSQTQRIERVAFPPKLRFLFAPSRGKVLFGGRGGAKSWGIARALLIMGADRPLRILCARETMRSLADSVHQLLCDQISLLDLGSFYSVQKAKITGRNGTTFLFGGLANDPDALKSVEGCDIVWVEEAQGVSKRSWDILTPTIRKEGSEIWMSFNPELDTDETYKRFVLNPPPGFVVQKLNYTDNPWCPKVLVQEAEHCQRTSPDDYRHIWEGFCRSAVEGAIYAREIEQAEADGRVCAVPYDRSAPVHTAWDLGYGDSTAIWFFQQVGFEYRHLSYHQNNGVGIDEYLRYLQTTGYVYGTHHLPHDADSGQLGTGKSIAQMVRNAGHRVHVVPRTASIVNDISQVRQRFPQCFFDAKGCEEGLYNLRRYRWETTAKSGDSVVYQRQPRHDQYSHTADGFRTFAVGFASPDRVETPATPSYYHSPSGEYSWMG
jgi:phage terminase large subunit